MLRTAGADAIPYLSLIHIYKGCPGYWQNAGEGRGGDSENDKIVLKYKSKQLDVYKRQALKQVPSCEFFPLQAVQTNVIGTDNVLESAIACLLYTSQRA